MSQKVGCVFSPLDKELAEKSLRLSRSQSTHKQALENRPYRFSKPIIHPIKLKHESRKGSTPDSIWPYLFKPHKLFKCIKQYHGSGSSFFWFGVVETVLLSYILGKTVFHLLYTEDNQEIADYYSERFFPRMYESFPYQYQLYPVIIVQSSMTLVVRLFVFARLVKRSIINRNGYKEIEMSQLNGAFIASLRWSMRDWIKLFFSSSWTHFKACRSKKVGRECDIDLKVEKQAHLYGQRLGSYSVLETNSFESLLEDNLIDFSKCYELYGFDTNFRNPKWHYPATNCRVDLWELSLIMFLIHTVTIGLSFVIVLLVLVGLFVELAVLSPNKFNSSFSDCIAQLPSLLMSPSHILRLSDQIILLISQMVHHIEASVTYTDLFSLMSRIRKLNERLQEDLDICRYYAYMQLLEDKKRGHERLSTEWIYSRQQNQCLDQKFKDNFQVEQGAYVYGNMSPQQKLAVNRSLEQSLVMAKIVNNEFMAIKKSITSYMDMLVMSSGFCISVAFMVLMDAQTNLIAFAVSVAVSSFSGPLVFSSVLCMIIEQMVSNKVHSLMSIELWD